MEQKKYYMMKYLCRSPSSSSPSSSAPCVGWFLRFAEHASLLFQHANGSFSLALLLVMGGGFIVAGSVVVVIVVVARRRRLPSLLWLCCCHDEVLKLNDYHISVYNKIITVTNNNVPTHPVACSIARAHSHKRTHTHIVCTIRNLISDVQFGWFFLSFYFYLI